MGLLLRVQDQNMPRSFGNRVRKLTVLFEDSAPLIASVGISQSYLRSIATAARFWRFPAAHKIFAMSSPEIGAASAQPDKSQTVTEADAKPEHVTIHGYAEGEDETLAPSPVEPPKPVSRWAVFQTDPCDIADRELQQQYADRDRETEALPFCSRSCRRIANYIRDLVSLRSQYPNPNRRHKFRGTDVRKPFFFRRWCISLSESILFRDFYIIAVLAQTVFLAAAGSRGVGKVGDGSYDAADTFFTALFTIEIVIKCIAEGVLVGPYAFAKDSWNYLDLWCVLFGWLKYYFDENYMAVFRATRLLIPLSRLELLPGLDVMTRCVLSSVGQLVEVVAIIILFLLFFSLIGLHLFMGMLRQRCQNPTTLEWEDTVFQYEPTGLCSMSASFGRRCPYEMVCTQYHTNPWYGAVSYDNIGTALLNTFVIVSRDGWTRIMFLLEDVSLRASRAYVIVIVLFGNLFLINLLTALITLRFDSERNKMRSILKAREQARLQEIEELRTRDEVLRKQQEQALVEKCNEGLDLTEEERKQLMKLSEDPTKFSTKILASKTWQFLHFFAVLGSLAVLGINEYKPSSARRAALFGGHAALCGIFTLEVLLKLHSLGFRLWYLTGYNLFEFVITVLMYMEFITRTDPDANMGVFGALSTFRFVILLDFMRPWRPVQLILGAVLRSFRDIGPLMVLVLLYIYVFAVITMQQLQDEFEDINKRYLHPITSPQDRWIGFSNFGWSCLSIFQIMTGENWFRMMYHAIGKRGWFMAVLFIIIYLVGNVLFISSVTAIMLGNFTDVADELDKEEKKRRENPEGHQLSGFPLMMEQLKQFFIKALCLERILAKFTKPPEIDQTAVYRINEVQHADEKIKDKALNKEYVNFAFSFVSVHQREGRENAEEKHLADMKSKAEADRRLLSRADLVDLYGTSCCFLWPDHPARQYSSNLVYHRLYWLISTGFVLLGIVILAVREPGVQPGSREKALMDAGDILMCVGFGFEFILKWIAFGLYGHKGSYLSDPWNWLDFAVVLTHTVYLVVTAVTDDYTVERIFICLLSIRALRVLVAFDATKRVLLTTMVTMPSFLKIVIMAGVFYLVFGILGIALFAGKFRRCYRPDGLPEFGVDEAQCLQAEGVWKNPPDGNFDDIAGALRTLYQIGTTDGWTQVMFLGIDATPAGMHPEVNYNTPIALYFFVFVIISSFFIVSVFIAFVAFTYMRLAQTASQSQDVDQINDHWITSWAQLLEVTPKRGSTDMVHSSVFRSKLYLLVTSAGWEVALAILIVLNTISMSLDIYAPSSSHESLLHIFDHIFVAIFLVELLIRWFALGSERFWGDSWNIMDFILVSLSIVGWFVELFKVQLGFRPRLLRVPRMIRMARVTRVIKRLQPLANTILVSFKQLVYICFLLAALLIMYAYMGMNLFGRVKHQTYINEHNNFESFGNALQLVFALATGENWTSYMFECQITEPHCNATNDYTNDCGWPTLAIVYFISFSMITTFVFLNLFVAVLLQNFKSSADLLPQPMTPAEARMITSLWSDDSTPKFTWVLMTVEQLISFVEILKLPFGLELNSTDIDANERRETFELWQFFEECPVPVRLYTLSEATTLGIDYKDRVKIESTERDLFVHYADVMLGLAARRFKKTFATYDPTKINKSEPAWRAVRKRYIDRFALSENDIVLPMNGVRALYMVIGHWRLLRMYYLKGKALEAKEREDAERQRRLALHRDANANNEEKKEATASSQTVTESWGDVPVLEDDDEDDIQGAMQEMVRPEGASSEEEDDDDDDSDGETEEEKRKKQQEKDDANLTQRPPSRYNREVKVRSFASPTDALRSIVDAQLDALDLPPEVRMQVTMAQMKTELARKRDEFKTSEQYETFKKAQEQVAALMRQIASPQSSTTSASSTPRVESEADTDISLESRSRNSRSSAESDAPLVRSAMSSSSSRRESAGRRVQFHGMDAVENDDDEKKRNSSSRRRR